MQKERPFKMKEIACHELHILAKILYLPMALFALMLGPSIEYQFFSDFKYSQQSNKA